MPRVKRITRLGRRTDAPPITAPSDRAISNRAISNRAISNRAGSNRAGSNRAGSWPDRRFAKETRQHRDGDCEVLTSRNRGVAERVADD